MTRLSRRDVLGMLVTAGTAALSIPRRVSSQAAPITIANQPVEIAVASISPYTARITVAPIENDRARAVPNDGSLVQAAWVSPRTRFRTLSRPQIVRLGNLAIRIESEPLSFSIQDRNGKVVQKLQIDQTGALSFQIADGPVLGLGEGGPQFGQ